MSVYNIKDLIRINQEIGESGDFRNKSSLEFALHYVKQKKSWLFELSYIVRALLIDHPFVDGNKRTALIICQLYFDDNKHEYKKQRLVDILHKIARKNITDINKIVRELLKC